MDLKGVVLAGGTGSRLMPLTKVTNKHLLPVGQKPMVYYPIEKLTSIGIEEILVVTGIEHMGDVVSLLGSGKGFWLPIHIQSPGRGRRNCTGVGVGREFCTRPAAGGYSW